MPENRFDFSPESLHIGGGDYKGVRTFSEHVKHIAASNSALWSAVTGDKFPKDFLGGHGPENVKTKAEILKFLKDSFALGSQGCVDADDIEYAATARKRQVDALAPGRIWCRTRV